MVAFSLNFAFLYTEGESMAQKKSEHRVPSRDERFRCKKTPRGNRLRQQSIHELQLQQNEEPRS
jgi:hypothetical protein